MMDTTTHQNTATGTLLVTGIGGQLAGRVVSLLLEKGHKGIIGTTRKPEKVEHFKTQGIDVRAANFDQPETLKEAFRGAHTMLLVSTHKIGQRLHQHRNAIDAAKAAGVQHVIYTSIQSADRFKSIVSTEHLETENYLKESGLKYTILRNNLYADGLIMKTKPFLQWGKFSGCAGDGAVAYITREDCARAATAVLMNAEKNQSQCFDINGPKAYTYSDVARVVAQVSGRKLEYVNDSAEAFKGALQKFGIPEVFAQAMTDFDIMAQEGYLNKSTSEDESAVKKLTGTESEDTESFLKRQSFN